MILSRTGAVLAAAMELAILVPMFGFLALPAVGFADELVLPVQQDRDWEQPEPGSRAATPANAGAAPGTPASAQGNRAADGVSAPRAGSGPSSSGGSPSPDSLSTARNPAAGLSAPPIMPGGPGRPTVINPQSSLGMEDDPAGDRKILQLRLRLAKNPTDTEAMGKLGLVYLDFARSTADPRFYSSADTLFHKALDQDSHDFAGLFGMGSLCLSRHDFRSALTWGRKALSAYPRSAPVLGVLVDANIELGRYSEAQKVLDAMLAIRPGLTSCSRASYLRELHGDLDGACAAMDMAARDGRPGSLDVAWCRSQLGDLLFRQGKVDEAEGVYREVDAERPGYPRALAGLARVAEARGNLGAAGRLLGVAVDAFPLAQFVIELGDLNAALGDHEQAERYYSQVRKAAEDARRNGLNVDLEMALFEVDHGADPVATAERAAKTYTDRPSLQAAHMYAWVLYRAGRIKEATAMIDRALSLGMRDPEWFYHAGMIYRAAGKETQAAQYLRAALAMNPAFSLVDAAEARKALAEVSGKSALASNDNNGLLTLAPIEISASRPRHPADPASASQGEIASNTLASRPLQRTGDVMEAVPGVVISQHSGEGKANQYYLRGFNLDHGTDLSMAVSGMPVNLPTHAHGQGYADLNFMIPELVSGIQYRKGTYFADEGDFSAAGAANISYRNSLDASEVKLTTGGDGFRRGLLAGSAGFAGGQALAALELSENNGPWVHPDQFRKVNGVLRFSRNDGPRSYNLTAMGYDGRWNSTDQVPVRAIESGMISRFGAIDPSDGGWSHRYSLSGEFQQDGPGRVTKANAYVFNYQLNLYSDFTYFLDDPVNGDQFEQADRRNVAGFGLSQLRSATWFHRKVENTFGAGARNDDIGGVGLYHTRQRERLETIRLDRVMETSGAVWAQNEIAWSPKVRTLTGLRADDYRFDVHSSLPVNSGRSNAALLSPKLSVLLGPWDGTEMFLNAGYGFHSNDARGATIRRDPKTGDPADRVTPLVRAKGGEIGMSSAAGTRLSGSISLWDLDLQSELLFLGDAGTTEPSRPSRRTGVEVNTVYALTRKLRADGSVAFSRARFTNADPVGNRIPGAPEEVISGGLSYQNARGWTAGFHVRQFGSRPLIEDNSVRSKPSTLLSSSIGYRLGGRWTATLECFNLANAKASDIDYYYTSRLPGEPADGVAGIHTHPTAARTFRLALTTDLRK